MALEGLHHVTAITADAPRNVDFYARLLGLRLIKKTVNFDQPDVYHLYYGDERATPGCVLTFFEFPTAAPGRAGDGMPYRIVWRVASGASLDFWSERLRDEGVDGARAADGAVAFADFEGLEHELVVDDVPDAPLTAVAADIPAEHALQGFAGVRAYAARPQASAGLLDALGFTGAGGAWRLAGSERRARWSYDEPPADVGVQGAGSIHHVAWSAADDDELAQLRLVASSAGARPTPIIDRQYFHSVYFREPSGVLFELATRDVGFTVDEPLESLGQALMLPPQHEPRRAVLERALTPISNPRQAS
jgi:glyoxalase family protein